MNVTFIFSVTCKRFGTENTLNTFILGTAGGKPICNFVQRSVSQPVT